MDRDRSLRVGRFRHVAGDSEADPSKPQQAAPKLRSRPSLQDDRNKLRFRKAQARSFCSSSSRLRALEPWPTRPRRSRFAQGTAFMRRLVSKVVAHDELLDAAEATVATILRNDQTALESAKETVLDVIGRPLDDQLAVEAVYGYALMGNPDIPDRLNRFYDKSDAGRVGKHATALSSRQT
jgi:hypothetical protein